MIFLVISLLLSLAFTAQPTENENNLLKEMIIRSALENMRNNYIQSIRDQVLLDHFNSVMMRSGNIGVNNIPNAFPSTLATSPFALPVLMGSAHSAFSVVEKGKKAKPSKKLAKSAISKEMLKVFQGHLKLDRNLYCLNLYCDNSLFEKKDHFCDPCYKFYKKEKGLRRSERIYGQVIRISSLSNPSASLSLSHVPESLNHLNAMDFNNNQMNMVAVHDSIPPMADNNPESIKETSLTDGDREKNPLQRDEPIANKEAGKENVTLSSATMTTITDNVVVDDNSQRGNGKEEARIDHDIDGYLNMHNLDNAEITEHQPLDASTLYGDDGIYAFDDFLIISKSERSIIVDKMIKKFKGRMIFNVNYDACLNSNCYAQLIDPIERICEKCYNQYIKDGTLRENKPNSDTNILK